MWLALSGAIYSRIALSFALNRIFFSANENGTVKQNNQSDLRLFKTSQSQCRKIKDKKGIVWQNGSNNVVIELRVVQFWSENHTCEFQSNWRCALFQFWCQNKIHSTQFNYHYKLFLEDRRHFSYYSRQLVSRYILVISQLVIFSPVRALTEWSGNDNLTVTLSSLVIMNEWMNECVFIYRTYHILSQGGGCLAYIPVGKSYLCLAYIPMPF